MRALIKLPIMAQESATQATPVRRLAPSTEESGLRAPSDAAVMYEPPGKAMAQTVDFSEVLSATLAYLARLRPITRWATPS
jgi:hypothetical protein